MLKQQIQLELNDSLKSGDQIKRLVLGMLMNAVKNRELAKRSLLSKAVSDVKELERQNQLTDEELTEVIWSEVKKRKEAIEQFESAGRNDLAEKEKKELEILSGYLPAQMSGSEIREEVRKTISDLKIVEAKEAGKVIGTIMSKFKGRLDGKLVGQIVLQELNKNL